MCSKVFKNRPKLLSVSITIRQILKSTLGIAKVILVDNILPVFRCMIIFMILKKW